jgi:hypothetical protein
MKGKKKPTAGEGPEVGLKGCHNTSDTSGILSDISEVCQFQALFKLAAQRGAVLSPTKTGRV